ncbi:MAG: hypothetical protein ACYS9X_14760 [Planctomycetota bacterium]|jgi:hypothetical protein
MGTARLFLLATSGALALGCGELALPREEVGPQPRLALLGARDEPGTFVIAGSHDGGLRYATKGAVSLGGGLDGARKDISASRRTVLRFDGTADPEFLAKLVRTFGETHGFWQEIALAERDPDAEFEGCEATVSLDRLSYAADEPVLLRIDVSRDVGTDTLTPWHVRIVDSRGEEVNILTRSLGGGHLYLAPVNRLPTKTFDLTSFAAPFSEEDYVWRFAPGRYSVTFHFSVGWPEWRKPFEGVRELGPREWGSKTSNTVSFEIRETPPPSPERVRAMLDEAARLAEGARALDVATSWPEKDARTREAVDVLKRVIVISSDLATVLEAVRRIGAVRADERFDPDAPPDSDALVLALANATERDRRAACDRYVRAWKRDMRDEADPVETKLVRSFPFRAFFEHPQFRPILEKQVRREAVEYPYAEVYLWHAGPKDAGVMARLLAQYPAQVFAYYDRRKVPPEVAALLPAYFGSETLVCEGSFGKWLCADAALAAFELAAGLDLGYRERADRIRDRELIAGVLRRWWRRNRNAFGAGERPEP